MSKLFTSLKIFLAAVLSVCALSAGWLQAQPYTRIDRADFSKIEPGEYIMASAFLFDSKNYYAFVGSFNSGGYYTGINVTQASNAPATLYELPSGVTVFVVEEYNGGMAIKDKGEGKYVTHSSKTTLALAASAQKWTFNNKGIRSTVASERCLHATPNSKISDTRINAAKETEGNIVLYKLEAAVTEPSLMASVSAIDLTGYMADENPVTVSQSFNVTGYNLTEGITAVVAGNGFSCTPTTLPAVGGTLTVSYTGEADATGSLTLKNADVEDVVIPLSATVRPVPTYSPFTAADLALMDVDESVYTLVVAVNGTSYYAMGAANSNNRKAVSVSLTDGSITHMPAATDDDVTNPYEIRITKKTASTYTLKVEASGKYLYYTTGNNMKEGTEEREWTIEIGSDGKAVIKDGTTPIRYNSSSNIFSCYPTGQDPVYLYHRGANAQAGVPFIDGNKKVFYTLEQGTGLSNKILTYDTANISGAIALQVKGEGGVASKITATAVASQAEGKYQVSLSSAAYTAAGVYNDTLVLTNGATETRSLLVITVNKPRTPKVVFTPEAGRYYYDSVRVELSAGSYDIYYTLDGTTPVDTVKDNCFKYSAPFTLNQTKTVKALAFDAAKERVTVADSLATGLFSVTAVTARNLGLFTGNHTDATPANGFHTNVTDDYNSDGTSLKFDAAGKFLMMKLKRAPDTLSYVLKGNKAGPGSSADYRGYVFSVDASVDGITWTRLATYDDKGVHDSIVLTGKTKKHVLQGLNYRFFRWTYDTITKGYIGLGTINAYKEVLPELSLGEDITLAKVHENVKTEAVFELYAVKLTAENATVSMVRNTNNAFTFKDTTVALVNGGVEAPLKVVYTGRLADAKDTAMLVAVAGTYKDTAYVFAESEIYRPTVATPVIKPNNLRHKDSVRITIECATDSAKIYFTLNGTEPTAATGTLYAAPFRLDSSATVKAIAVRNGYNASAVAEKRYTVTNTPVPVGDIRFEEKFSKIKEACTTAIAAKDFDAKMDEPGWTGSYVYEEINAVKLGSGSYAGKFTTRELNLKGNEGVFYLNFKAAVLDEDAAIKVSVGGFDTLISDFLPVMGSTLANAEGMEEFVLKLSGGDFKSRISFENTAKKKRFFLGEVVVYQEGEQPVFVPDTVKKPVIAPDGGEFEDDVEVSISCATDGSTIYYRTSTAAAFRAYSKAFTLKDSAVVEAYAVKTDLIASDTVKAVFCITRPAAPVDTTQEEEPVVADSLALLREDFSGCTARNWSGVDITDSLDSFTDVKGWIGLKVYEGMGGVRLGSSKANGELVSPVVKLDAKKAEYTLVFRAGAWKNTDVLTVSAGEEEFEAEGLPVIAENQGTGLKEFVFTFTGGKAETQITFWADNRIMLDSIRIYQLDTTSVVPGPVDTGSGPVVVVRDTVAAPRILPNGGVFGDSVSVAFVCDTADADIYYRLDEEGEFVLYTGKLKLYDTCTLEAYAAKEGLVNSPVVSAVFYIVKTADTGTSGPNVGLEAEAFGLKTNLYPNPTTGKMTVDVAEDALLEVFNVSGLRLYSTRLAAGKHELNLRSVSGAAGIYILRLTASDHRTAVKRVILK